MYNVLMCMCVYLLLVVHVGIYMYIHMKIIKFPMASFHYWPTIAFHIGLHVPHSQPHPSQSLQ